MKISFIGVGNVGGTLAQSFGRKGHTIYLGSRDPNQDSNSHSIAQSIGANCSVCTIESAISQSEVVVLATPWSAVDSVIREYKNLLKGKILIDCTNPLKSDLSGLTLGTDTSGAEQIQAALPETAVIKAFNTVGFNIMANPIIDGKKVVLYYCGNDSKARHSARELIQEVGFEPMDAGSIQSARLLEPFALLWISSAYRFGLGREFGFVIAKRSTP